MIDIVDLDVVFLTYNEPNKDQNWVAISNMVPWAKRVDGVVGSDAAHKAAADVSETERFILIDGDNMPHADFFNQQLPIDPLVKLGKHCVLRWKARNVINGLAYGNGGLSCWTRTFIKNMKTHEATDGAIETCVEFCFDPQYIPMHNIYSDTRPNESPMQAWIAGFREGVKLSLNRGERVDSLPQGENLDRLRVWATVGEDVKNGYWAMIGARYGMQQIMMDKTWDYTEVRDFKKLESIWNSGVVEHTEDISLTVLGIPDMMDTEHSKMFKHYYKKLHKQMDIMTTEAEALAV